MSIGESFEDEGNINGKIWAKEKASSTAAIWRRIVQIQIIQAVKCKCSVIESRDT